MIEAQAVGGLCFASGGISLLPIRADPTYYPALLERTLGKPYFLKYCNHQSFRATRDRAKGGQGEGPGQNWTSRTLAAFCVQ